jgi:glycosyltransferase involved in cell wall biosynthesis
MSHKDTISRSVASMHDAGTPTVTLVVAMRNESDAIEACLASIAAQDYPPDRLEVLIYDGDSTDDSVARATAFAGGRPGWAVVRNPRRVQAAAWNAGIAAAHGEIVGIVSGHAELDPEYAAAAVRVLAETGADMVGGPVHAMGEGTMAEAIAIATGTAFGVGGSRHHQVTERTEVDTVFMGVCRRETWLRFPFAEEMVRNQDDELSYRLLEAGGRIICDPSIRSRYRSRGTLGGLWRQYFDYGRWKVRVIQAHPRRARIRHVIPLGLVTWIGAGSAASLVFGPARIATAAGMGAYGAATAVASITATMGRPGQRVAAILLPAIYPVMHVAYGVGMLRGLWQFRGRWRSRTPQGPGPEPN